MNTIRKGTLAVLRDCLVDTRQLPLGGGSQAVTENVIGIVMDDPTDDGYMDVKTLGHGDLFWAPILGVREDIIVLAQGADPEKDVREELMRLLPQVIINLAVASREQLYELEVADL